MVPNGLIVLFSREMQQDFDGWSRLDFGRLCGFNGIAKEGRCEGIGCVVLSPSLVLFF